MIVFGAPTYMGGPSWQFKKFADASSKPWYHKVWRNKIESLHDPRRFGITTPAISPEARASIAPRPP